MAKHLIENKSVGMENAEVKSEQLIDFEFPLQHKTIRAKNLQEAQRELDRSKQSSQENINNQQ